jgi:hypothetical protein
VSDKWPAAPIPPTLDRFLESLAEPSGLRTGDVIRHPRGTERPGRQGNGSDPTAARRCAADGHHRFPSTRTGTWHRCLAGPATMVHCAASKCHGTSLLVGRGKRGACDYGGWCRRMCRCETWVSGFPPRDGEDGTLHRQRLVLPVSRDLARAGGTTCRASPR